MSITREEKYINRFVFVESYIECLFMDIRESISEWSQNNDEIKSISRKNVFLVIFSFFIFYDNIKKR